MGLDPHTFRQQVWREGARQVHAHLDWLDAVAAEYGRWAPLLRVFAADCRHRSPAPNVDDLFGSTRAQCDVLMTKMNAFAQSEDGRFLLGRTLQQLVVLSTSLIALGAAEQLFRSGGAVILEHSEQLHWFTEVYKSSRNAPWWYARGWWTIEDGCGREFELTGRVASTSPLGSSYWTVRFGMQWGPLAGSHMSELWKWDGERATCIDGLQMQF
jgi:hypothetical protein